MLPLANQTWWWGPIVTSNISTNLFLVVNWVRWGCQIVQNKYISHPLPPDSPLSPLTPPPTQPLLPQQTVFNQMFKCRIFNFKFTKCKYTILTSFPIEACKCNLSPFELWQTDRRRTNQPNVQQTGSSQGTLPRAWTLESKNDLKMLLLPKWWWTSKERGT